MQGTDESVAEQGYQESVDAGTFDVSMSFVWPYWWGWCPTYYTPWVYDYHAPYQYGNYYQNGLWSCQQPVYDPFTCQFSQGIPPQEGIPPRIEEVDEERRSGTIDDDRSTSSHSTADTVIYGVNSRQPGSTDPVYHAGISRRRPRPQIVSEPVDTLSPEEKSDYAHFKEIYQKEQKQEDTSPDSREIYQRVYHDYARYAGIPEEINYTLDYHFPDKDDLVGLTRYYHSYEWDRTKGWSPHERVTLLDHHALSIATKSKRDNPEDDSSHAYKHFRSGGSEIYVILMHCIPDSATRLANRVDEEPIACFETKGDVLYVVKDDFNVRQLHAPPEITQKLVGEMALCGYKVDGSEIVVRGQQDIGRIYTTIHSKYHRHRH
jgi:hypothetical protein